MAASFEVLRTIECLLEHSGSVAEYAHRANVLYNRVGIVYRAALVDMIQETEDIRMLVKVREYRKVHYHLSNATDGGDEGENILADIIVKKHKFSFFDQGC